MPGRPCLTCGALVDGGSWCPGHEPERASRRTPGRGTGTDAAAFRRAVLEAAGYRCEVVERGRRCDVRGAAGLEAHHVVPIRAGGDPTDPENGRAVCRRHHRLIEPR